MWSGRIVPLLSQDRLASLSAHSIGATEPHKHRGPPQSGIATEWLPEALDFENLLLPLPSDVTAATGVQNGSSVYVSWWVNPPPQEQKQGEDIDQHPPESPIFGPDIAACVMVSPFPFSLLSGEFIQLVARLSHRSGALLDIVGRALACKAQIIQVEGMSTGSESALIHFPRDSHNGSKEKEKESQLESWNRMNKFLAGIEEQRELYHSVLGKSPTKEEIEEKENSKLIDWYAKVPRRFDRWLASEHNREVKSLESDGLKNAEKFYSVWHRVFRFGLIEDFQNNPTTGDGPYQLSGRDWKKCGATIGESTIKAKTDVEEIVLDFSNLEKPDRTVKETIIDEMCRIPLGRILRDYQNEIERSYKSTKIKEETKKEILENLQRHSIPRYALLVREPDLPVIMAMIPRRSLFQMTLPLRSSTLLHQNPGQGVLESILKVLSGRHINIWHTSLLPTTTDFEPTPNDLPKSSVYQASFVKAELKVVGAFQEEWLNRDEKSIKMAFHELEDQILGIRLTPAARADALIDLPRDSKIKQTIIGHFQNEKLEGHDKGLKNGKLTLRHAMEPDSKVNEWLKDEREKANNLNKLLKSDLQDVEGWITAIRDREGEPILHDRSDINIGAPPLLRIFFSHSANPSDEEQGYIDNVRQVLSRYSMSVIEGQYSTGHTINQASRGRIRQCTALISLFWPREEFVDKNGQHLPAEWIAHEESYALGLGLSVYRIIEASVRTPRYEEDRPALRFVRSDYMSWKKAVEQLDIELKEFLFNEYRRLSYWTAS